MEGKQSSELKNKAVEDYLRDYLQTGDSARFAVLLTGEWGCGKTHFIQNFMDKWAGEGVFASICSAAQSQRKQLYISLYGIETLEELREQIFIALYPVSGKVRQGLKLIDNINVGLPKILSISVKPKDIAKATDKILLWLRDAALVFDDLERCSIPIAELFGFINNLVESQGIKTILVANEAKIEEKDKKYKEIKEKLIGATLEVQSDPQLVLKSLLGEMERGKARECAEIYENEIIRIFTGINILNYRSLRVALYDFARLLKNISEAAPFFADDKASTYKTANSNSQEAIKQLLMLMLVIDIQYRAGKLDFQILMTDPQTLHRVSMLNQLANMNAPETDEEKKRLKEAEEREQKFYAEQDKEDVLLEYNRKFSKGYIVPYAILGGFLHSGALDSGAIELYLKNYYLFEPLFPKEAAKRPVWTELRDALYLLLDKEEFKKFERRFQEELNNCEITSPSIIIGIVSNLIVAQEKSSRELEFVKPDIGAYFYDYVIRLGEKGLIKWEEFEDIDSIFGTLGLNQDNPIFKKLQDAFTIVLGNRYQADAERLFRDFKENKISNTHKILQAHGTQPIVSFWNVAEVSKFIFTYKSIISDYPLYTFLHRYYRDGIGGQKETEQKWFEQLKIEMGKYADELDDSQKAVAEHIIGYLFNKQD